MCLKVLKMLSRLGKCYQSLVDLIDILMTVFSSRVLDLTPWVLKTVTDTLRNTNIKDALHS